MYTIKLSNNTGTFPKMWECKQPEQLNWEYIENADNKYHLWTIDDAQEGDVLAINWHENDDSWEKIIIFKKYHNKGVEGLFNAPRVEGYGNTFKNGKLAFQWEEVPYYSKTWTDNLHPATKEQCDLLFQNIQRNMFDEFKQYFKL